MALTLELPEDIEDAVQVEAERRGLEAGDFTQLAVVWLLVYLDNTNFERSAGATDMDPLVAFYRSWRAANTYQETNTYQEKIVSALDERLHKWLPDKQTSESKRALTDQEIATRLAALRAIGSYDTRSVAGLPPLSDEDISRESIYGERGL